MSDTDVVAELYSAIEQSARLLDVPCAPDTVRPVLHAYRETLPEAVIAFRVGTGTRYQGDIDWRFTVPRDVDPYAVARAHGLTDRPDHPIADLLTDVRQRCPVDSFGVDFGVVGGFKKIYVFFPADDMQSLSRLAAVPSMPRGLADKLDFFTRHGLADHKVNVFGIDYRHRSVNVYFGALPEQCRQPATIRAMVGELGLPQPSEQMVRLGERAFGIYTSLGWESSRIDRYCFAVMTPDAATLPVPIEPRIERFLSSMPHGGTDTRFVYYAAVSAADDEHYKLQSYYHWQPRMLDQMLVSESGRQRD